MPSFTDLGVPARLTDVLTRLAIETPTPIQRATLPDALAGRDVLGRGRTGSGKTLAFLLPMVARLTASRSRRTPKRPRALILAPTRELVSQIDAALAPPTFDPATAITGELAWIGRHMTPWIVRRIRSNHNTVAAW